MDGVFQILADQPLLLLALLLAVGAGIGSVKVLGVSLGPAAVLFTAIGFSAWAVADGHTLAIPEAVGTFGLVLFTYTVGVVAGPQFFASLGRGWLPMVAAAVALGLTGVFTTVAGALMGLSYPMIAGVYSGATTNLPAMAAAAARSGDAAGPTVGVSITYLGGVLVMLLVAGWVLRRPGAEPHHTALDHLTVRVENVHGLTMSELAARYGNAVSISRVKREHEDNLLISPEGSEPIQTGDLLTVVGPNEVLQQVAVELGHVSSHDIAAERDGLDYRRITLSRSALAGHTVGELELGRRFGAGVSRVRRGDQDLVAHDTFVLQMGDRLRVIAPRSRMSEVGEYLGDSDRGLSDINLVGLALGLAVGLAVGLVHIPLPGGGFTIGAAGGTIVVGLLFGRIGRIGPIVTSMSHGAAQSLSALGIVAFLAYAGVGAGQNITEALSGDGWRIAVLGAVATLVAGVLVVLALHTTSRLPWLETAGGLSGAQTQPAVLAFVNERTAHDTRVGIGYALIYPVAMIIKIVVAQVIAGL